jgi:SET domain-containing protein
MYVTKIEARESGIDGKGVFALEPIPKGTVVWKFDPNHDKTISREAFDASYEATQTELKHIAYLSKNTNRWIFPPENDPARYTNHSKENNLSVVLDESISEEPFFIANRDIATDEELTNDYLEFDQFSLTAESPWLK